MKKIINFSLAVVLFSSLAGCCFFYLDLDKGKTTTLKQFISARGAPENTEIYKIDGDEYRVLFYRKYADDSSFSPLIFKNGVLDGWGMKYYQEIKENFSE